MDRISVRTRDALTDGTMFRIHRDDTSAGLLRRAPQQYAGRDQRFLVGQGKIDSSFEGGEAGSQSRSAGDSVEDQVEVHLSDRFQLCNFPCHDTDLGGSGAFEKVCFIGIDHDQTFRSELLRLFEYRSHSAPAGQKHRDKDAP